MVRDDVVDFAVEHEDLTPRELAVRYTDEKRSFVSESSVYRSLGTEDLITAPAQVVIKAADKVRDRTSRPDTASVAKPTGPKRKEQAAEAHTKK